MGVHRIRQLGEWWYLRPTNGTACSESREETHMSEGARNTTGFGRREFLGGALATAAIGTAVRAGVEMVAPAEAYAQSNLTPDEALRPPLHGNGRFGAKTL